MQTAAQSDVEENAHGGDDEDDDDSVFDQPITGILHRTEESRDSGIVCLLFYFLIIPNSYQLFFMIL